jgi:hypothetical protein
VPLSKEQVLAKAKKALADFKAKTPTTYEEFILHGQNVVRSGFVYYDKLFNKPPGSARGRGVGDCYEIKRAFMACIIFDPMQQFDVAAINALILDLKFFRYPEFTDRFLERMQSETSLVLNHMSQRYDWNGTAEAIKFNKSLAERNARLRQARHGEMHTSGADAAEAIHVDTDTQLSRVRFYKTWLETPAERARRIWEWWRQKMVRFGVQTFPCWAKALRLVALARSSSGACERVFSHLTRLMHILGHNALARNIETRMMKKANRGLY